MRPMRAAWGAAVWAACLAAPSWAAPPEPHPASPEAPVKRIVEQALSRGSKVIVRRVDYADGADPSLPEAPAGPVKSKTYIEIDSRPPGSPDDRELLESQRRVEESQREMLRAADAIGESQARGVEGLGAIQGRGAELSGGMRDAAAGTEALRGEVAGTGAKAGEVGDGVGESARIMRQIDSQVKELSGSIDELSSRMDDAPRPGGGAAGDARRDVEGAREGAAEAAREAGR